MGGGSHQALDPPPCFEEGLLRIEGFCISSLEKPTCGPTSGGPTIQLFVETNLRIEWQS